MLGPGLFPQSHQKDGQLVARVSVLPRDANRPSRAGRPSDSAGRRSSTSPIPCPGWRSLWAKQDHCLVDLASGAPRPVNCALQVPLVSPTIQYLRALLGTRKTSAASLRPSAVSAAAEEGEAASLAPVARGGHRAGGARQVKLQVAQSHLRPHPGPRGGHTGPHPPVFLGGGGGRHSKKNIHIPSWPGLQGASPYHGLAARRISLIGRRPTT